MIPTSWVTGTFFFLVSFGQWLNSFYHFQQLPRPQGIIRVDLVDGTRREKIRSSEVYFYVRNWEVAKVKTLNRD